MEDQSRALSSFDTAELARFGIRCQNFSGSNDNTIFVSVEAASHRGLEINFSGTNNKIDLRGQQFPAGRLSILGEKGLVRINTDQEVVIDAYIYDQAQLLIEKPRAIFGLWSSVAANTSLSISSGALFAEGVKIFTTDHHSVIDLDTGQQINFPGDVVIQEDVWIASDVTILKNSTIGRGSVIGARSVVTGSVPSTELWIGQPARCLKQRVSWVPSHPADPSDVERMMADLNLFSKKAT